MKYKVSDLAHFKSQLLNQIISEWQLQVDSLENEIQNQIDCLPDQCAPYSDFSIKEIAEQKARLTLSDLRTPLQELKSYLNKDMLAQGEHIKEFSIFDLTVTEPGGIGKTTTFLYSHLID